MNQWNILTPVEYIEITKQRIFDTIELKTNGCWLWKGYLCAPKRQYGLSSSLLDGKKKKILAHRLSYRLFNGDIPKGQCVLHKCDNPKCVNPDHLWLGDNKDNQHDMMKKGRGKKAFGENAHKAKFTESDIIAIRKMREDGFLFREISEKFNTSTGNISSIIHRQSWKHIQESQK